MRALLSAFALILASATPLLPTAAHADEDGRPTCQYTDPDNYFCL